jgi:hypothetical protein
MRLSRKLPEVIVEKDFIVEVGMSEPADQTKPLTNPGTQTGSLDFRIKNFRIKKMVI